MLFIAVRIKKDYNYYVHLILSQLFYQLHYWIIYVLLTYYTYDKNSS